MEFSSKRGGGGGAVQPLTREQFELQIFSKRRGGGGVGGPDPPGSAPEVGTITRSFQQNTTCTCIGSMSTGTMQCILTHSLVSYND